VIEEWRRLRDFGLRIHSERECIAQDMQKLQKKFELACENHDKASRYLQQLTQIRAQTHAQLEIWELEDQLRIHQKKRHLYLHAAKRIFGILRMNELFELMLREMADHIQHALHSSLDILRDLAEGRQPERHLESEFARACGQMHSYRKLYEQVPPRPGLE
jgi:hypothetical protein